MIFNIFIFVGVVICGYVVNVFGLGIVIVVGGVVEIIVGIGILLFIKLVKVEWFDLIKEREVSVYL